MTVERVENNNLPAARPTARVPIPLGRALTEFDQVWRLAGNLAQSPLLPTSLTKNANKTQANVALIIMYGAELGLAPMQALQSIYVVNGRPQMSGQLWLAKVREAGHKVEKLEHTAAKCTIRITRGDSGEQWTETFTIEEARTAGLAGKDVWKAYPKRMLQWRAVSNCATSICPEVALGFGLEENEPEPDVSQALAQAVDARTPQPEPEPAEDDVQDAEVVEDEPQQSDEEVREELLRMAAEHQGDGEQADVWPETAEPGSWGED